MLVLRLIEPFRGVWQVAPLISCLVEGPENSVKCQYDCKTDSLAPIVYVEREESDERDEEEVRSLVFLLNEGRTEQTEDRHG